MTSMIVAAAVWAIAASIAVALVLGGAAAVLIRVAQPTAATRHVLWLVTLFIVGCAPIAIMSTMTVRGYASPEAPIVTRAVNAPFTNRDVEEALRDRDLRDSATPAARTPARAWFALPTLGERLADGIVIVWLAGVLVGCVRLTRSLVRVHGLKGRSTPLLGALTHELPWLTAGRGREIYLRLSYEIETPMAIGFRRPVVLVPAEMATADGLAAIEPIVIHEYTHLSRYDDWTNLGQRIIELLFWFNPLVWAIGRCVVLEREVAADEAVIDRTHDAGEYAATLWQMVREMRMPEGVVVAPGAILTRRQISVRIERLLDESTRRPVLRLASVGLGLAGIAAVTTIAIAAPALRVPYEVKLSYTVTQTPTTDAPAAHPHTRPAAKLKPAPAVAIAQRQDAKLSHVSVKPRALAASTPRPRTIAFHEATVSVIRRPLLAVLPVAPVAAPAAPPTAPPVSRPQSPAPAPSEPVVKLFMQLPGIAKIALDEKSVAAALANAIASESPSPASRPALPRELIRQCNGCDLHGRDLQGLDLSNVSLVGVNLRHANLRGANLSGASLLGVDLDGANLRDANLHNARFQGSSIDHTDFTGANLEGARFHGMSLETAHLGSNGTLRSLVDGCVGCNFSGLDLHGQDLHDLQLNGANLSGADLTGANLRRAHLTGVNLSGAKLDRADLTDAALNGVNMSGATVDGAILTGIHLVGSVLP